MASSIYAATPKRGNNDTKHHSKYKVNTQTVHDPTLQVLSSQQDQQKTGQEIKMDVYRLRLRPAPIEAVLLPAPSL
jgi:hypothetical protein